MAQIKLFGSQIIAPTTDLNIFTSYDADVRREDTNVVRLLIDGSGVAPASQINIFLPPISDFDTIWNTQIIICDISGTSATENIVIFPNGELGDKIYDSTGTNWVLATNNGTATLEIVDKTKWMASGGSIAPLITACYSGTYTLPVTTFGNPVLVTSVSIGGVPTAVTPPINVLNTNALFQWLNDNGVICSAVTYTNNGINSNTLRVFNSVSVLNNFVINTTPPTTTAFIVVPCP
jgi:hypothetical protein